jgi:triosephosphate isomerase
MLARLGVNYVIVGPLRAPAALRSDRRAGGGHVRAVLRHAMTPIVCVGETAEEREAGETEEVLDRSRPPRR